MRKKSSEDPEAIGNPNLLWYVTSNYFLHYPQLGKWLRFTKKVIKTNAVCDTDYIYFDTYHDSQDVYKDLLWFQVLVMRKSDIDKGLKQVR